MTEVPSTVSLGLRAEDVGGKSDKRRKNGSGLMGGGGPQGSWVVCGRGTEKRGRPGRWVLRKRKEVTD